MYPVTGPHDTEIGGVEPMPTLYSYQRAYRQAKPFNMVLPYERRLAEVVRTPDSSYNARSAVAGMTQSDWPFTFLHARAYEKFKDRITSSANLLVNLAEVDRSYAMITQRSGQLFQFGRRLARGDLVGAANVLKLSSVPKGASKKKGYAGNYLEFHFGWAPLVGDIWSAIDHIQSPIKSTRVSATVKDPEVRIREIIFHDENPGAFYPNWRYYDDVVFNEGTPLVRIGGEVAVSNPNLHLANSLGLVNPMILAYELIPFSFIADWFVNVEQVLASATDFLGLTLSNTYTTFHVRGRYHSEQKEAWVYPDFYPDSHGLPSSYARQCKGNFSYTRRWQGISAPELHVRPYKAWGLRRAAAAVSLLVLQLKGR